MTSTQRRKSLPGSKCGKTAWAVEEAPRPTGEAIAVRSTSYANVLEPDDSKMTVRTAIALINEVREEILAEEDSGYDAETRFCLDWFQTFDMNNGKSGDAVSMANAYNLGLGDLEHAGVFFVKGGVTRIVKRSEIPDDWHPSIDTRLMHWECTQHLIRVLEAEDGSAEAAARLIAALNPRRCCRRRAEAAALERGAA